MLNMGTKINDKYMVGIDIDNKEEGNIFNGLTKWREILKK